MAALRATRLPTGSWEAVTPWDLRLCWGLRFGFWDLLFGMSDKRHRDPHARAGLLAAGEHVGLGLQRPVVVRLGDEFGGVDGFAGEEHEDAGVAGVDRGGARFEHLFEVENAGLGVPLGVGGDEEFQLR